MANELNKRMKRGTHRLIHRHHQWLQKEKCQLVPRSPAPSDGEKLDRKSFLNRRNNVKVGGTVVLTD